MTTEPVFWKGSSQIPDRQLKTIRNIQWSYRLFRRPSSPSALLYALLRSFLTSIASGNSGCARSLSFHIRLPPDSASRRTPSPSAVSSPLPGRFGTPSRQERAPPGTKKRSASLRNGSSVIMTINFRKSSRGKSIAVCKKIHKTFIIGAGMPSLII